MSIKPLSNEEIMPSGIYCPNCPRYEKGKSPDGASVCRKCRTIYRCVQLIGIEFCFDCYTPRVNFPYTRFKKFAKSWNKYRQDFISNHIFLKKNGVNEFLNETKLKSSKERKFDG
ncbi:MAG: DUF3795 domain-containing protein [Candidatus Lokiarchaeota archaeon]|nr:DUF3795 domain-containing protein [Candidatus Lokiarchaeota archaeon]MBD3202462.1 DUF3795 domain-containing protein [Candidatus Lokiarchaeota archaeon]